MKLMNLSLKQFIFVLVLFVPSLALASERPSFQFERNKLPAEIEESRGFNWNLELNEEGILFSLDTDFIEPQDLSSIQGEPGWEYRLDIDGITIWREFKAGAKTESRYTIPFKQLENGKHEVALVLRDISGREHFHDGIVELDCSPLISIENKENTEFFNPQLKVRFWGEQDGVVGFVDLLLDGRLLKTKTVEKEQNGTTILVSEILGKELLSGDLLPGNHLFQIVANGVNGSVASRSISVKGNSDPPTLKITLDDDQSFKTLEIHFPPSSAPHGLFALQQGMATLYSQRADHQTLIITRKQILDALDSHNLSFQGEPVAFLIYTSSSNQVENWQELQFK